MNIFAGILLGYLIFTLGKIILWKAYSQQTNPQKEARYYKTLFTINAKTNAFRRKIKSVNANRRDS